MKKILLIATMVLMGVSAGDCFEFNWWPSAAGKGLEEAAIKSSLYIIHEELVLSLDGSRLYSAGQTGFGTAEGARIGFTGRHGDRKAHIYCDNFSDDKGYGLRISRYSAPCKKDDCPAPIEEKTIRFSDFGSVQYEVGRAGDRKTVIRFTPVVMAPKEEAAASYSERRLRLDGALLRNGREVVASGLSAEGGIVELSKPGFGTLAVSHKPFSGASAIGVISGSSLSFELGGDSFKWLCTRDILPEGRWLAWVKYEPAAAVDRGTTIRGR
jgi:hypothetical protein